LIATDRFSKSGQPSASVFRRFICRDPFAGLLLYELAERRQLRYISSSKRPSTLSGVEIAGR
jgi:hypothetical protein